MYILQYKSILVESTRNFKNYYKHYFHHNQMWMGILVLKIFYMNVCVYLAMFQELRTLCTVTYLWSWLWGVPRPRAGCGGRCASSAETSTNSTSLRTCPTPAATTLSCTPSMINCSQQLSTLSLAVGKDITTRTYFQQNSLLFFYIT